MGKMSVEVANVMSTKRRKGILNHLCINPEMFAPIDGVSAAESHVAMRAAREFEHGEAGMLVFSELFPKQKFCMIAQLSEKYIGYVNSEGEKRQWGFGDIVKTSPVVKIHRAYVSEQQHDRYPGEYFVIETENSYYVTKHLYMTEESKKERREIFRLQHEAATRTMPGNMYCNLSVI